MSEAHDTTLALAASLDLTAAGPLKAQLLERRGQDLALDGAGVERLGGLCLQVLLAADATWAEDGRSLRIVNPSPALADAFALMGAVVPGASEEIPQ
jgi:chemotaxis protein CheX